jgi:hypothetical protein
MTEPHGRMPGHPAYDRDDRCPTCHVPPRAPHLRSCVDEGVWRGEPEGGHDTKAPGRLGEDRRHHW